MWTIRTLTRLGKAVVWMSNASLRQERSIRIERLFPVIANEQRECGDPAHCINALIPRWPHILTDAGHDDNLLL